MEKLSDKKSFGILCPPFFGHLYPMLSLALELKQREHEVTLFYYLNSEFMTKIHEYGIKTFSVCSQSDVKLLSHELEVLRKLVGWKANDQTILIYEMLAKINLQYLTDGIRNAECNILLIDQTLFEGESIASLMNLPFINICNALMLNPDLNIPPLFMRWQYKHSIIGLVRNFFGYLYIGLRSGNTMKLVSQYRRQKKLSQYPSTLDKDYFEYLWSNAATITQQPAEFEFPRSTVTENFHFTGPFTNSKIREEVYFPWEKLNGKPIIYASLGTLQNSIDGNIFDEIAKACIGLDYQLVISLGKRDSTEQKIATDKLPENAIVVDYAPQLELLEKASLCITHAGINTTLESLSNGVPMVAIPIANDQLGVGSRIEWTGTGKVLKYDCNSEKLNKAIREVLSNNSYRQNALKMKQKIESSEGVKRAADIIEEVLS